MPTWPMICPRHASRLTRRRGREHLDATRVALQCSWDDLKGRRSRVDVPERTCCFEELGTAPRVDVDAGLLRSGSDPIRVDVGRESAVTCAGLIRRDSGVVREDRGCEGARRESSVGRTGAIGGVVGSHRARSGSDPACLDGRRERSRPCGRSPEASRGQAESDRAESVWVACVCMTVGVIGQRRGSDRCDADRIRPEKKTCPRSRTSVGNVRLTTPASLAMTPA